MYESSSPWDNPSHIGSTVLVDTGFHNWCILGTIRERRVNYGDTEYLIAPLRYSPDGEDVEENRPAWVKNWNLTFKAVPSLYLANYNYEEVVNESSEE